MTSVPSKYLVPRDNVIFELGLDGRSGRSRTFIVYEEGAKVKTPSDLAGVTTAPFEMGERGSETLLRSVEGQVFPRSFSLGMPQGEQMRQTA
jgi:predicted nucleotide-binding protein